MSPSGHWVVFNLRRGNPSTDEYTNQWMILDLSTGESRVVINDAGPPLLSYGDGLPPVDDYNQGVQQFSPAWSTDEQRFFYVRRDQEGIRLYAANIESGKSTVVPLPKGKITDLRDEGAVALVTLEAPDPGAADSVLEHRIKGVLFTGQFTAVNGIPRFQPPTQQRVLRLNLSTGAVSDTTEAQDRCEAFPGWPRDQDLTMLFTDCIRTPEGKSLATGSDLRAPRQSTALYVSGGTTPTRISPAYDWLSGPPVWNQGSYYYVAGNSYAHSDLYDLNGSGVVTRITHSDYFLSNCRFNFHALPFAICTAETLTTPRELARVDLRDGHIEILTDLNPEYNKLRHPRTDEVDWADSTGDLLRGTVTYPLDYDSTRAYPLIVTSYPHAGFSRGSNGDEFPIPVFATNGFLVLDVDAPVGQFWTSFDITYHTFAQGYASPLRALEQYLRRLGRQGIADLKHVGICGLSGGADFAAYAISHSSSFSAAIFDWDESSYLAAITLSTERGREWQRRRGLGAADSVHWNSYSLARRAASVDAAVLLNVADTEFFHAWEDYGALKGHGTPVEMWLYPEAQHVKWQPGQRLTIYNRNLDWFNYWLRDRRDPDPSKVKQYRRWDGLRAGGTSRSK